MIAIYADTAAPEEMAALARNPVVKGFTSNPTLVKKAGLKNYHQWIHHVCAGFPSYPISIEVVSDDFDDMERQALRLRECGDNVFVKIPVVNSKGESALPLVKRLASMGVPVNVTAVMSMAQIDAIRGSLTETPAIVSVFAGRIADTGRNPAGTIKYALSRKLSVSHKVLWASTRQVLDVYVADSLGCDIITCSPEIIGKLALEGKNLEDFSRETAAMFLNDAMAAGLNF